MHLGFGIVIVGVILACCGWLISMFIKTWDYWDIVEKENDLTGQHSELLEL